MRFGIQLGVDAPTDPRELAALAVAAEALPFDSLWVGDHIVIPREVDDEAHRRAVGGTKRFADRTRVPIAEPLVTLSYLAAVAPQLQLGLAVLVVPLRNPVVCAKMISAIDVLSDGRLNVGIGAGWIEPEFDAVRAGPYAERGKVTDEYLDLMIELWTADEPHFDGAYYQLDGVTMYPKPISKPHPPIWIGGNGDKALRRTARLGRGWLPLFLAPEELARKRSRLQELCAEVGRDGADVRIALGCRFGFVDASGADRPALTGSTAQMREDLHRYEDVGCEEIHLVCPRPAMDVASLVAEWERFFDEVVGR